MVKPVLIIVYNVRLKEEGRLYKSTISATKIVGES